MDSTSPECSDGNDGPSAPSEFLAEFLSAIMRRQYAEALKYCRLILQYEPHNATARGFYPLLQHKLDKHHSSKEESCSSEDTSLFRDHSKKEEPREELMEQDADESGSESCSGAASGASQSSLELDSSLSRTERSERSEWDSSASRSEPDPDDNGNAPAAAPLAPGDVENDNAAGGGARPAHAQGEAASASLRRLRAHFSCSIK